MTVITATLDLTHREESFAQYGNTDLVVQVNNPKFHEMGRPDQIVVQISVPRKAS